MVLKWKLAAACAFSVLISSCGQQNPSPSQSTPVQSANQFSDDAGVDVQSLAKEIGAEGGTLQFGSSLLRVPKNAVDEQVRFQVKRLPVPQNPLKLPPFTGYNGRFLIGDVAGREVSQVLLVETNAPKPPAEVQITIKPIGRKGGKDAIDVVYSVVDGTEEPRLLGVFKNASEYIIPDVFLRTSKSSSRLRVFVVRADLKEFERRCQVEGGTVDYGCEFYNKERPQKMNAQAAYKTMSALTWNVGNVATSCSAYNFKLCYESTRVNITEKIAELEAGTPFGIITLQELWPGDCTNNFDISPGRLCSGEFAGKVNPHVVTRILGAYATRYRYQCSTTEYGRYECTGVDKNLFEVVSGTNQYINGGCQQDTGFFLHDFRFIPTASNITVVNTHMVGASPTQATCRNTQLVALKNKFQNYRPQLFIAGDFNTRADEISTPGATYRSMFSSPGTYDSTKIAQEHTLPYQTTATYVGVSYAYDHVLSNFMEFPEGTTRCTVGDLFFQGGGTDHNYVMCRLRGLFGQ